MDSATLATSEGMTVTRRLTASNNLRIFKNGVSIASTSLVPTALPNFSLSSLASNQGTVNFASSAINMAFYFVGISSEVDQLAAYTAVNDYINSL